MSTSGVRRIRRTGVCVVRAEPQGESLLISVSGNADVEHRTPTHLYGHARDVRRTLELVVDFLNEVAALNDRDLAEMPLADPDGHEDREEDGDADPPRPLG